METTALPWTEETVDKLVNGTAILKRGELHVPCRLNQEEKKIFNEAKSLGYISIRGKRRNLEVIWWQWCSVNKIPFIVIKPQVKYAVVDYDLIEDYPYYISESCLEILVTLYYRVNQTNNSTIPLLFPSRQQGQFRVLLEDSSKVAEQVLEIINTDWSNYKSHIKDEYLKTANGFRPSPE